MMFLKLVIILSTLLATARTTICAGDANSAQPLHKHISDSVDLVCHHHHCAGVYVDEHFNHSTLQWDVTHEGSYHYTIAALKLVDDGSYRCYKSCHNRRQSAYCYPTVTGMKLTIIL